MTLEYDKTGLTYKGHTIAIEIHSKDSFDVYFDIIGTSVLGRKFKVRTPSICFENYQNKTLSIQDRFLEYIKR